MNEILQSHIPYDTSPRALPGIQPLEMADWLIVDDAYAGQMARRMALMAQDAAAVCAMDAGAKPAAQELLEMVLAQLSARHDFTVTATTVHCPDGRVVGVDANCPLETLNQLVQEDFCILDKQLDEHVLVAALLCFPASWLLSEKFMRPLSAIHDPVQAYDSNIAARVQRLFDGVRPGRPLWRFNALWYADPDLHQPRSMHSQRPDHGATQGRYFRSERQSVLRLPQTGSVVFSIHTFVTLGG